MTSEPQFIHPVHGLPVKLGRTLARRNRRSHIRRDILYSFLESLPLAPESFDNTSGIKKWGMMKNDDLGDCTIAAPGHLVQAWTAAAGKLVTIPDREIVKAYCAFDGYVIGDPSTDNGGDILTVCNDWHKYGIDGHFIDAHAEVNMTQMRWQQAMWLFGGLNCGVNLPMSAQAQTGAGTWDIVDFARGEDAQPGSWGPHCTVAVEFHKDVVGFVTWGLLQYATWRFVMHYFDEAIACMSPEWKGAPNIGTMSLLDRLQQVGT